MRNIRLTIEYDGTDYHGWQVQPGLRTIQGFIQEAIGRITHETVNLAGSGRTDAGVHAYNQVANFRTISSIPCNRLLKGLNALLPDDIVIRDLSDAPDDFHARFSATGKIYLYRILNRPVRSPFDNRYAWYISIPLDATLMQKASSLLLGRHDFSTFRASSCRAPDPFKIVRSARVNVAADMIEFEVEASGFLHHMVRNIVGSLVEVGKGSFPPEWFNHLLEKKDRRLAAITAPATGLFLKEVRY